MNTISTTSIRAVNKYNNYFLRNLDMSLIGCRLPVVDTLSTGGVSENQRDADILYTL